MPQRGRYGIFISIPWVMRILAYLEEQGEAQSLWELDSMFLFPC